MCTELAFETASMDAIAYCRDGDLSVRTYDLFHRGRESDVAFYVEAALRYDGPVLELGAGTGRVAWPIAAAGLECVGADLAEPMLAIARAKAKLYDPEVAGRASFLRADMSDFDLGRRFRTVVIAFRSFQHLITETAQRSALRCIHAHLEPEGRLIVNLFDPRLDMLLPEAPAPMDRWRSRIRRPGSASAAASWRGSSTR